MRKVVVIETYGQVFFFETKEGLSKKIIYRLMQSVGWFLPPEEGERGEWIELGAVGNGISYRIIEEDPTNWRGNFTGYSIQVRQICRDNFMDEIEGVLPTARGGLATEIFLKGFCPEEISRMVEELERIPKLRKIRPVRTNGKIIFPKQGGSEGWLEIHIQ